MPGSQAAATSDRVICVPLRTRPTADRRPDLPNEGVTCTYIYTLTGILTHGSIDLVRDHQPSFSTILAGNQIADSVLGLADGIEGLNTRRTILRAPGGMLGSL